MHSLQDMYPAAGLSLDNATLDSMDESAEPKLFLNENRMPVMIEFSTAIVYLAFAVLILALVFILPGVRKTKLRSLLGLATIITLGASILIALLGNSWLIGQVEVRDISYSSLSSETFSGKIKVEIGLSSLNVSMFGMLSGQEHKSVNYNERLYWDRPDLMINQHLEALRRGLPHPLLTVTEFFSQDSDGFNWTRQLRQAGYYSSLILYVALASWFLTTLIMCVIPVYLPHMMQLTGALVMCSVWIFSLLVESPRNFALQIGGNSAEFAFGHTAVLTFATGALSMFSGILMLAMQLTSPTEPLTIMDSDSFTKDQHFLYNNNLIGSLIGKKQSVTEKMAQNILANHVIIPISDIEANFGQQTQKR